MPTLCLHPARALRPQDLARAPADRHRLMKQQVCASESDHASLNGET